MDYNKLHMPRKLKIANATFKGDCSGCTYYEAFDQVCCRNETYLGDKSNAQFIGNGRKCGLEPDKIYRENLSI